MQNKITQPTRLLDENGELKQKGYATSLILDYRKKDVKANKIRMKEWDYYLIQNEDFGVALTIDNNTYMGLISASFLDFKSKKEKTTSIMLPFPGNKLRLPETSVIGDIKYQDNRVKASFCHDSGNRKLYLEMKNFDGNSDLKVSVVLSKTPKDSMVISTPFKEDKKAFYYNQKIIGMSAQGKVTYQDKIYEFQPDNSFGLLDWGRGVWTYENTWYWSAGQTLINGKVFGFNLGYGFGDTTAASENMLFYDGVAHKLENVLFKIPQNKHNEFEYMKPWTFTSSDQRFEMDFEPILDRNANISAVVISSDQHQVFGKLSGRAVLEDGRVIEVKDMLVFAERVKNRW